MGFVSYDLEQNVILGSAPIGPDGIGEFSSVRISPSGTHVIVGYDENSVLLDVELTMLRVLDQRDRGGNVVALAVSRVLEHVGDLIVTRGRFSKDLRQRRGAAVDRSQQSRGRCRALGMRAAADRGELRTLRDRDRRFVTDQRDIDDLL